MRKLLIISVSFVLFSLGSCTQETLVAPDYQVSQAAPNNTLTILENDEISLSNSSQNFTIQVNVGDVTISTANNELTIEFTANYDFSNVIPESTQSLDFENAQSNISTFSLDINNYLGENGRFEVTFDLGTNDLSGLELTPTQVVGIEDIIVF
ncbi:MAG: hypothetical protein AAFP82_03490 [Bacteroidota bacterium]